jgi:Pectate lyase superfamily protein
MLRLVRLSNSQALGYGSGGLGFGSTNIFYRQIRNFVLDMTAMPASQSATGIHWPTAQATSIQNCVFLMSDAPGTKHQGIFIEEGKLNRDVMVRFASKSVSNVN